MDLKNFGKSIPKYIKRCKLKKHILVCIENIFYFLCNKNRTLISLPQSQSRMGGKNNGQKHKAPRNLFGSCRGDTEGPKVISTMK